MSKEDNGKFSWFGTEYSRIPVEIYEALNKPVVLPNAMDVQVGGGHYKDMAIQPTEYCQRNHLDACESNIVKYASRHKNKGKLEDVKKIKHYAELLAWLEYGEVI